MGKGAFYARLTTVVLTLVTNLETKISLLKGKGGGREFLDAAFMGEDRPCEIMRAVATMR